MPDVSDVFKSPPKAEIERLRARALFAHILWSPPGEADRGVAQRRGASCASSVIDQRPRVDVRAGVGRGRLGRVLSSYASQARLRGSGCGGRSGGDLLEGGRSQLVDFEGEGIAMGAESLESPGEIGLDGYADRAVGRDDAEQDAGATGPSVLPAKSMFRRGPRGSETLSRWASCRSARPGRRRRERARRGDSCST